MPAQPQRLWLLSAIALAMLAGCLDAQPPTLPDGQMDYCTASAELKDGWTVVRVIGTNWAPRHEPGGEGSDAPSLADASVWIRYQSGELGEKRPMDENGCALLTFQQVSSPVSVQACLSSNPDYNNCETRGHCYWLGGHEEMAWVPTMPYKEVTLEFYYTCKD